MGKLIRFLGFLLGLVVILVVGLSIAVPLLLDPNDYKDKITEVVQEATGRELVIGGDIGLTVFPWLGLELGDVQVSNAKGFGESPFAQIEDANVRVKLLPLLRKQVEMDTIVLKGLQLNLAKDKNGRSNWDDLVSEKSEPSSDTTGDKSIALDSLALGGIQLQDASVVWDDRSTGSHYVIKDLSLTSAAVQLDSPFDVDIAFQLQSADPEIRADMEISGEVWVSSSMQQFRVSNLSTSIQAQGKELPNGKVEAELKSELQLDLEKQVFDLTQLGLEVLGLQLDGNLHGSAILGNAPKYTGTLDLQQFVPREVMQALGMEVPQTADVNTLTKADGYLELIGGSNHVQIKPFRMRLDDTGINGSLAINNFSAPAIKIDLIIDTLDLDRYLPASSEASAPATPAAGTAASASLFPVDALRSLNLSGSLKIGALKAFGIRSSDVLMEVLAKNGKLRLYPASAKMYQGSYSGDITIDASGSKPRLSMHETVSKVQIGPLLKDLTGKEKLTGTADVKINLSGIGQDITAIQKTLNGDASFTFSDGAIKGVNLAKVIREGKAKFEGKSATTDSGPNQTDFSAMHGTAKITNGIVRNEDFEAKSPLMRLEGKGKVDLVAETIDYLLTVKLVGSLEGQGGKGLTGLKGIAIPIRVGGTFAKPTYRPDLQAALGDAVKEKVEEQVEEQKEKIQKKLEEEIQDKLGDQFKDGLKGLF